MITLFSWLIHQSSCLFIFVNYTNLFLSRKSYGHFLQRTEENLSTNLCLNFFYVLLFLGIAMEQRQIMTLPSILPKAWLFSPQLSPTET